MPQVEALVEVKAAKRLSGLTPLLRGWTSAVLDYCEQHAYEDNCWWYNERASLSVLAGAAWRTKGWTALEEFSTEKQGDVPSEHLEHGSLVRGRCDLYVTNRTSAYAVEAKQAWQSIGRRAQIDHIDRAMDLAWKDASKLTEDEADYRVAITFGVIYLPVSEVTCRGSAGVIKVDEALVRDSVEGWVDRFKEASFDAYALVFPGRVREFVSPDGRNIFPGTVLCAKKWDAESE